MADRSVAETLREPVAPKVREACDRLVADAPPEVSGRIMAGVEAGTYCSVGDIQQARADMARHPVDCD